MKDCRFQMDQGRSRRIPERRGRRRKRGNEPFLFTTEENGGGASLEKGFQKIGTAKG